MRTRIAGLITLTLLGLVGGLTSPAYADRHAAVDQTGDAAELATGIPYIPAPNHTDADVVKSVVNHKRRSVIVIVNLSDLTKVRSGEEFDLIAAIKTNKKRYSVTLSSFNGRVGLQLVRGSRTISCAGAGRALSVSEDRLKVRVPRSCLGNPRWIKVGLSTFAAVDGGSFVDDAFGPQVVDSSTALRFTPRLKRA